MEVSKMTVFIVIFSIICLTLLCIAMSARIVMLENSMSGIERHMAIVCNVMSHFKAEAEAHMTNKEIHVHPIVVDDIKSFCKTRDCKNCKHYILQDIKYRYDGADEKIYGCESWDCKFEAKGDT